jgi:hypothetical protein
MIRYNCASTAMVNLSEYVILYFSSVIDENRI